jgi:hypothetical protein
MDWMDGWICGHIGMNEMMHLYAMLNIFFC